MKVLKAIFWLTAIFAMLTMMSWALFTCVSDTGEALAKNQANKCKVGNYCNINGHGFLKTSHAGARR